MGRYLGSRCKLCRTEGTKLFLKGEKCYTLKCPLAPSHPRSKVALRYRRGRRSKVSPYKQQLREKQKARRQAGIQEAQFRKYFKIASRKKGLTGEELLKMLILRLDNIVYRLGFAQSRTQARQLIRHSHVLVDGKNVNIPSFQVKENQEITLKEKTKSLEIVKQALEKAQERGRPEWLSFDEANRRGKIEKTPQIEEIKQEMPVQEQLIVEFYSR